MDLGSGAKSNRSVFTSESNRICWKMGCTNWKLMNYFKHFLYASHNPLRSPTNPNDKSPIEPNSTPLGNIFSVKMQTANWKLKTTKLHLPLQWPIANANATDTLGHVLAVWLVRWSGCRSWPLNGNNQATLSGESEESPPYPTLFTHILEKRRNNAKCSSHNLLNLLLHCKKNLIKLWGLSFQKYI